MKVLVVAAHPDDEILGCGGTVARLTQEGHSTEFVILGEGITSRFAKREDADSRLIQQLHETARAAGKIVGARAVTHENLPDNRFDTVPLLDIVKIIERHIERVCPDVVFVQHGGDLNIDHALTFRATLAATRPVAGKCVREVYAFEVASSTEWAFQKFEPAFRPNTFWDVSETIEKKIAAMECYQAESRAFPHPRSPEALRAQALRWGSVAGFPAAEAFELVRSVRGKWLT